MPRRPGRGPLPIWVASISIRSAVAGRMRLRHLVADLLDEYVAGIQQLRRQHDVADVESRDDAGQDHADVATGLG